MSEESLPARARVLNAKELALLDSLLAADPALAYLRPDLPLAHVEDLKDGQMGSIRFVDHASRRIGREAVAAVFRDDDHVAVEIAITLDEQGQLFELDMWKVDFSPLLRFPEPGELRRA